MTDHRFLDLAELLDPGDLLVVNETRVRAARLIGTRVGTGGRVELFVLSRRGPGEWDALARPSRRLRPGVQIEFGGLVATVQNKSAGALVVTFDSEDDEAAIERAGTVPLPPYFTGSVADDRYQTMFASKLGSAAAPTAGLHFTPQVLERLRDKAIELARVELHVSLDTFRPIASEDIDDHVMHSEWCSVSEETVRAVTHAQRVIAVGTTVVRTLESHVDEKGRLRAGDMHTKLFLKPGHEFKVVDGLITNFHMPGSTLLVLLAAFMGERWRDAYQTALSRGYRFLSFGDAMFAVRT